MKSKPVSVVVKNTASVASRTIEKVESVVDTAAAAINDVTSPVRETFAQKYPTIFSLLVTVGATATFLGFEQLLLAWSLLERYPLIILGFGIAVLLLTGTLYKKLQ